MKKSATKSKNLLWIVILLILLILAIILVIYFFFVKPFNNQGNPIPGVDNEIVCTNLGGIVRTARDFKTSPCLDGEIDLGFVKNLKCACHCCGVQ